MGAFVNILNQTTQMLLDLDPDGKEDLAKLQGKVLCLEITRPALTLYMIPDENGLALANEYDGEPDVILTGPLTAFVELARSDSQNNAVIQGQVKMQGDTDAGQAFQKALSRIDIDWEELIAKFVGDMPARKIGNAIRGFSDWAAESTELSRSNFAEYLQEEKQVLVTHLAQERFVGNVDELRADVDRLEQRIIRLKGRLKGEVKKQQAGGEENP